MVQGARDRPGRPSPAPRSKPRCAATRCSSSARRLGVTVEEVEHVLGGAHRALDPAQRIARRSGPRAGRSATSSSSAAMANRLPSVVVWAATLWVRPVSGWSAYWAARAPRRARAATIRSRTSSSDWRDLHLLDVLGQVAAGHPLVDVLGAGERGELLDAGLHVVAGDPLARGDGRPGRPGRAPPRRPRSPRRAPGYRGRAAPAAPRSTARARARTLCSGDHSAAISAEAYRWARTLGIVVTAPLSQPPSEPGSTVRRLRTRFRCFTPRWAGGARSSHPVLLLGRACQWVVTADSGANPFAGRGAAA